MDIHQLELFLAVMKRASVTRAAEEVYLSRGAGEGFVAGAGRVRGY